MKVSAFKIEVDGKILDYRLGQDLNLDNVREFFERKYKIKKLWSGGRHVLGVLEKNSKEFFLKLATTEGISAVTRIEYDWNGAFNKASSRSKSSFWVPVNCESGVFKNNLFYLITDRFRGELLSQSPNGGRITKTFVESLDYVIDFSEFIQELEIEIPSPHVLSTTDDYQNWFINKVKAWFESASENVQNKYKLEELLNIVERGISLLDLKHRHGDFTPWHLFKLDSGKLGLIDGEHAKADSVEGYDIGYLIQRVFSVLKRTKLAEQIFQKLVKRQYSVEKLRVILAARAIGGFLDESLVENPDYLQAVKFRNWVVSL